MFYSHEILTSRKYGVATVWLVATLGAKPNTKKVNRKAILNVDVQKACETISEPEAPMALRLQSNLLYGVSKVYDQQCFYVLQDAQSAQYAIRALIKSSRNNQLDLEAGKARPEQLILIDDPAFLPEEALPPLEFDFNMHTGDTQHSSQSLMSVRHRTGSISPHDGSMIGLNIPSSNGSYVLPGNYPLGESSGNKAFTGGEVFQEEPMLYEDDFIFDFDADGQLRDIPEDEAEALRAGSVRPHARMSNSAASGRVRKPHEDGRAVASYNNDDDLNVKLGDDDAGTFLDVEAFDVPLYSGLPFMSGGLGGDDQRLQHSADDRVHSKEPSCVSAVAKQKRKRVTKIKTLTADSQLELKNSDLKTAQRDYVENMKKNTFAKASHKAVLQAKKNAFHYVYGTGLNGVGEGIGSSKFQSPLAMFSGESLMALLTIPLPTKLKRGTKRPSPSSSPSAKRMRESELGRDASSVQHNLEDDGGMMMMGNDDQHSQSIELGRDAASALPDHPSSVMMPWNVSASLNSHQRHASSSIKGGRAGILGSAMGRRMTSPLLRRGSNLPGDLEQFSMLHEGDDVPVMYGRDDDLSVGGSRARVFISLSQISRANAANIDEFEIFGPAANVDTQTAGTSQWIRDALDKESNNFLEYVCNTISEKTGDELGDDFDAGLGMAENEKFVTFEELFVVEANSKVVAAQAFYHVLCLATQHRVWVHQNGIEELEPWGEIRIGVVI